MISNIESKVSPSDAHTVTSVRGEESDKNVSFEDTSVRTISTLRTEKLRWLIHLQKYYQ